MSPFGLKHTHSFENFNIAFGIKLHIMAEAVFEVEEEFFSLYPSDYVRSLVHVDVLITTMTLLVVKSDILSHFVLL